MTNISEDGSPSKNVRWDPLPGAAAWRCGFWTKCGMSSKIMPRELHDVHLTTLHVATFVDNTEAHNELHWRRLHSPFQLLIGRSPPGLALEDDKEMGENTASLTTDGRRRRHTQRRCYKSHTCMKNRDFNSNNARCTWWSCGEMMLVLAIKSSFTSQNEREWAIQGEHVLDQKEFKCNKEKAHVKEASTKQ